MRLRVLRLFGLAVLLGLLLAPESIAQQAGGEAAATACDFAAAGEGWGLLSADQDRPFAEAPLPVDAAVPHTQAEITNISAIARGFLADPGIVGRGQVEQPRPLPSATEPEYTIPQPLFPASASAAQPGGERTASFGIGGALDPTRQISFGVARVDSEAAKAPSSASSTARIANASFTPGPNAAGAGPPEDAADGPVTRGLVTIGALATRSTSHRDDDTDVVRGFASSLASDIDIAGVVRIRAFEAVAEAVTGGAKPVRRALARINGFAVGGEPVAFDEKGLEQANAALEALGVELFPAHTVSTSNAGEENAIVSGLAIRFENVDSSGERRRVNLILGYARATSKCLDAGGGESAEAGTGVDTGVLGSSEENTAPSDTDVAAPTSDALAGAAPAADTAAGLETSVGAGPVRVVRQASTGDLVLRWDWSKLKLVFWSAGDSFTALGSFGLFLLAAFLLWQRRRLTRSL